MAVASTERLIRATPRLSLAAGPGAVWQKRLSPQASQDKIAREQLRAEARALLQLDHPGLFKILAVVEEGGVPVQRLVPPFDDSSSVLTLEQFVRAPRRPTPEVAAAILQQVAAAFAHAHQAGLVHGALEPTCVLLGDGGQVKVSDFLVGTGHRPLVPGRAASVETDVQALLQLHAWILGLEVSPWVASSPGTAAAVEVLARADKGATDLLGGWRDVPHRSAIPAAETLPRGSAAAAEPATKVHDLRAELESDRLGSVIDDRYRLIERIGGGGMGTVYRAEQLRVAREVALKILRPPGDEAERGELVARFQNEARAIAQLKHPNTVHLYDFGQLGADQLYLVTELLSGQTLEQALLAGPMAPIHALQIAAEVADALAEAHSKNIVHRDVCPRNVFLDQVGDRQVAKLLDFGVARLTGRSLGTRAGQAIGTPAYMSPEQAAGLAASPRSDLYSLGVVLFECLVGHPPFNAGTVPALLAKHLEAPPPKLAEVAPKLAQRPALGLLLEELLAKRPEDRPAGAAALRDRLLSLSKLAEPPESSIELSPRVTAIGPYQLGGSLGSTPTSEVHRARDTRNGREVAIKVLTDRALSSPTLTARMRREADGLERMRHPNIVQVLEFGVTPDGRPFLVMELLPGRTLRELILARAKLSPSEAASIVGQVASALSYAHQAGVVHRDLKPGNIMVLGEGPGVRVKVIDFGLLKWNDGEVRTSLTRREALLGTPAYVAPEQIYDASGSGPRADLYSLGCILYAMLAGRPPFTGSVSEVLESHYIKAPPVLPPAQGLEGLAAKLMAKMPGDRPESAEVVLRELEGLGFQRPIESTVEITDTAGLESPTMSRTPLTGPTRPSVVPLASVLPAQSPPPLRAALVLLAVLLALMAGLFLLLRREAPRKVAQAPQVVVEPPVIAPGAIAKPIEEPNLQPVLVVLEPPATKRAETVKVNAPSPKGPSPWATLDESIERITGNEHCTRTEAAEWKEMIEYREARSSNDPTAATQAVAALEQASRDGKLASQVARRRLDRLGRELGNAKDQLEVDELGRLQRRFFDLGARLSRATGIEEQRNLAEEISVASEELSRARR